MVLFYVKELASPQIIDNVAHSFEFQMRFNIKEILIVKHSYPMVIIGAGPYGLSISAHLKARGIPTLVLGEPMELWKKMPDGLCLKSVWSASSLSDPAGSYSIDRYIEEKKLSPGTNSFAIFSRLYSMVPGLHQA